MHPLTHRRHAHLTLPVVLAALAALTLAPAAHAADDAAPAAPVLAVEQLDATLYRISGTAAGGVLVLVGEAGLLLVDSGDAGEAAAFDSVLRTISALPVTHIVNTHYHFDHVGGNARHGRGAKVIAHRNLWAQAQKDTVIEDWGNWHRKPAPEGAEPTVLVDDSLRIDFEGDPVVAFHLPAAHTNGDLAVWFPRHDVLHTGDVVEIGAPPFVDLWAGGSVGGMIAAAHRLMRVAGDATRIVPGHGPVIDRGQLVAYRAMLGEIATRAHEAIGEERGLESFVELEAAQPYEAQLGGKRGARQLCALFYYGLNGMKK